MFRDRFSFVTEVNNAFEGWLDGGWRRVEGAERERRKKTSSLTEFVVIAALIRE